MALAFLLMLASGTAMVFGDLAPALKFRLYQWHKSLGVLLLLAAVLRLGLRLLVRPPALPASIAGLEALAAKAAHVALYIFMLAVPLSGWVMVSANVIGIPTIVFGWFQWPHLPGLGPDAGVEGAAKSVHFWLTLGFAGLIAVHVAAVVKHLVFDRENILARMWWGRGKDA